jgi:hypothetical protein
MVVDAAENELMLAVGVGAIVVVVVVDVVVLVDVEDVLVDVEDVLVDVLDVTVGVVVVVDVVVLVDVELLLVVVPVGTVVVVVDVLVVVLGSVVPGGILTTPAGTVVVVLIEKMIQFCEIIPAAHFLVVRTTSRDFELLQTVREPVVDGIDIYLVPDLHRTVFRTKSCFVAGFSQITVLAGVLAGTCLLDPVKHRFLMAAVTTPDLLLTHTEVVVLPSALLLWKRKRNTRVRATAAPNIRRDMTPRKAVTSACCT